MTAEGETTSPGVGDVHDAAHWDARYTSSATSPFIDPDPALLALIEAHTREIGMPGGRPHGPPLRALDLGCGEGRHAIWLATQGWQVTAVDFSRVALDRARSLAHAQAEKSGHGHALADNPDNQDNQDNQDDNADPIEWVVADVSTWLTQSKSESPHPAYELIVLAYLRLEEDYLDTARSLLTPGGHLLALSHGQGGKGPRQTRFRTTAETMRERAGDLEIVTCAEVWRAADDGEERSCIALLARRPVAS